MTILFDKIVTKIEHAIEQVPATQDIYAEGRLIRIIGLTLEAIGCKASIGSRCLVTNPNGQSLIAEVVGFAGEKSYLMSAADMTGLMPGASIIPLAKAMSVPVSDQLLGRILNGQGQPLDGFGLIKADEEYPLMGHTVNPLARNCIQQPLDVGIRAINALLTIGRGQRMGLFAGSGVGKSVLLGMMTRFTQADVIVVGLIGERGREVKEFIEHNLGEEGLRRSVVIAAPADSSPLMRLQGAMWATTVAEYFRDKGCHVLLLIDSLTRFAQAQRELGLAIGEPPITKGYPPSVFAKLSQLVERAGNGSGQQGSITGIYTVLVEGDDQQDPIADAARSFLDGHIELSRRLADAGHHPAIDVEQSISRVMQTIVSDHHLNIARQFKRYYTKYMQNRDLINIGAYSTGQDPELDQAIEWISALNNFLIQDTNEKIDYNESTGELEQLFAKGNSE